jgi:ubiquinone/menaquinone biosynthesis C-methylase UbiE
VSDHAAFVGSVPEHYERFLAPFFFEPFADDLARRLKPRPGRRVLELACGTGVLTERILREVDGDSRVMATDLNEAMIDVARRKISDPRVSWHQADATALPFDDASFDAVVCQFGWMFFPDKDHAMREARRVLASGGQLAFNTWDSLDSCPVAAHADATIRSCFPSDPPTFYETPFSMYDMGILRNMIENASFGSISIERVSLQGTSLPSAQAASGIVRGGPFAAEILQRGGNVGTVVATLAERLAARFGTEPFPSPMRAFVGTATAR